ncbi:hypothetical protein Ancab_011321 [Ancistrocladus abbreviatus]
MKCHKFAGSHGSRSGGGLTVRSLPDAKRGLAWSKISINSGRMVDSKVPDSNDDRPWKNGGLG